MHGLKYILDVGKIQHSEAPSLDIQDNQPKVAILKNARVFCFFICLFISLSVSHTCTCAHMSIHLTANQKLPTTFSTFVKAKLAKKGFTQ